jgi:hypothetical protein
LVASNYVVRATKNGAQTILNNGTNQVITLSADFDPNGWFSSNKIQPTIAGYYRINGQVWWDAASISNNQTNIQFRKNGSTGIGINQTQLLSGSGYAQQLDIVHYLNGTTDYVEITAFTGNTTSQGVNSAVTGTYFEAFLIVGNAATSGTSGSSGSSGTSGANGSSGASGSSGTSGANGSSGASGSSGTSGTSGANGNNTPLSFMGSFPG